MGRYQSTVHQLTPTQKYICGVVDGVTIAMVIAVLILVAL
jgi:hypothetical protein